MKRDSLTKFGAVLLHGLLVTAALILVAQLFPIKEVFEYDHDEGGNLIKAFLYMNGYALFREIWSDQPALFTVLLSWWFQIFGASVYHARLLVLTFSGILIWSLFQIIRENDGAFCGLIAVILLTLSADYVTLSSSVMIGLPAIALALFSTWLLVLYGKSRRRPYLIASGVVMAVALQTKLLAVVLLPAMLYEIFLPETDAAGNDKQISGAISRFSLWGVTLLLVYGFTALVLSPVDFSQLLQPHLTGIHIGFRGDSDLYKFIMQDSDLALLALAALFLLFLDQKPLLLLPFLWLACGLLFISVHKPIWSHHYLLISVPMCWIAALGVARLFHRTHWGGWSAKAMIAKPIHTTALLFVAASICLVIIKVPGKYERLVRRLSGGGFPSAYHHTITLMEKYGKNNHWIVTDRPIFAFYAKLFVPPELAVFSWKRLATGNLSVDEILNHIRKYRPGLILFNRFPALEKKILPGIEKDYRPVYQNQNPYIRLYLLNQREEPALKAPKGRSD